VGQNLPADFYVSYRLVSAGIKIYCYPSSNNDNGILVTSVTFEPVGAATIGAALGNSPQFGDFNIIENGYYKQTTTIASRDTQQHCYIPIDESFWDYAQIPNVGGLMKSGFAWTGYITGAAPSATIARVEFVANYEALLDNTYTDYLPSEPPSEDIEPKNIFRTLSTIKNDLTALTPTRMNSIIETPEVTKEEITLPPPKMLINSITDQIKNATGALKDTTSAMLSVVKSPEKKLNFLEKAMDFLSPIASSIVQNVARKYVGLMPLFS